MSTVTLVLAPSGFGKSTSMRSLNPNSVHLIACLDKPLPFRADKLGWKKCTKDNPSGSVMFTDNPEKIRTILEKSDRDIIIIDDLQSVMSNKFMGGVTQKKVGDQAFQMWNEIAYDLWSIIKTAASLPDHKRVYILTHSETDEVGFTKMKTLGKLLDSKVSVESLSTIVLRGMVINGNHKFSTRNNGADTTKTPIGMFDEELIDNDLALVDKAICEYYEIGVAE